MKGIKLKLHQWVFRQLRGSLANDLIPRSGEEGKKVNCFVVALDKGNEPYLRITEINGDNLTVKEWDGSSYAKEYIKTIQSIEDEYLLITHYYGLATIKYYGISDYILNKLLKIAYIKIHIVWFISRLDQHFFNKKKLVTKRRIELLRLLIDNHINSRHTGIGLIMLMSRLYSSKWILHPDKETQQKHVELYLDSLIESGEIIKTGAEYSVTGKAISTIEKYEEDERRHSDNVKLQKKAVLLTVIIAFLGLVQAGLIKLPTIVDFETKQPIKSETHNKANQH